MSKPVASVRVYTPQGRFVEIEAVFDTGSHYTIVRESDLPPGATLIPYARKKKAGTAMEGTALVIVGSTELEIEIGERRINVLARVAPKLSRPLVIGAGAMQEWDITIKNKNGKTSVAVGRDMRDPDITIVL